MWHNWTGPDPADQHVSVLLITELTSSKWKGPLVRLSLIPWGNKIPKAELHKKRLIRELGAPSPPVILPEWLLLLKSQLATITVTPRSYMGTVAFFFLFYKCVVV